MDWQTVSTSVLASSVFASVITAYASRRSSERLIQIENITKERKNWREKIREQALEVQRAVTNKDDTKLAELRLTFSLILNPDDKEDRAIISLIGRLASTKSPDEKVFVEFSDRLALLLKHDWERAKMEAGLLPKVSVWEMGRRLVERLRKGCLAPARIKYRDWEHSHLRTISGTTT